MLHALVKRPHYFLNETVDLYTWLKFFKVTAASLFVGAACVSFLLESFRERQRIVYRVCAPAFAATWILGFLLLHAGGIPALQTWIVLGLFCSFVALQILLYAAGKDGRNGTLPRALAAFFILCTLFVMAKRPP